MNIADYNFHDWKIIRENFCRRTFLAIPLLEHGENAIKRSFLMISKVHPWSEMNYFISIDDKWLYWKSLFHGIVDHHVPVRRIKSREFSAPWVTQDMRKLTSARIVEKLIGQRVLMIGTDIAIYVILQPVHYVQLRLSTSRRFAKTMVRMKRQRCSDPVQLVQVGAEDLTDVKDIANAFGAHFAATNGDTTL